MNEHRDIKSAVELFLESERNYPGRPALEKGKEVMSYTVLKNYSGRIASLIRSRAGDGDYVAVVADRSLFSYAAVLGILLAGKGFVPMNPKFPPARNEEMARRSGCHLLLHSGEHPVPLDISLDTITPADITGETGVHVPSMISRESPAYLLFTSGTTGRPKGVPVNMGNLSSYLQHMLRTYDLRPDDRFSQVFDLTFDLSMHDIFLALAAGACLVIPEEDSPLSFYHYIRRKELTAWFSVPTAARMMDRMRLLKEGSLPRLRFSFFCGEPLGVREAEAWKKAAVNSSLVNLYGPTEATIAISEYVWEEKSGFRSCNGVVSIGRIFSGQGYRISFEDDREDKGELWLAGSQVVEGYYLDEDNTRNSFIRMGDGSCWYKTGDLVSRDEEGYLYFLGRTDQEVKVHGYRVNLLEIEEVLINASGSHSAVIHLREKENDKLVAFVENKKDITEKSLLGHCRLILPWYMVPEMIIFVESMPVNPNGKTDRKKLKEMIANE